MRAGCPKLPRIEKSLPVFHQFPTCHTVFQHVDYQKMILVQNKHDFRNQHKRLHRIA